MNKFTKQGFCLIIGLGCNELYDVKVEPERIRLLKEFFLGN